MGRIIILCVEDEAAVREAIRQDLDGFAGHFPVELAEDTREAEEVIKTREAAGDRIGLILCDHILPGETGVDFLVRCDATPRGHLTRKVLLTGQAGHEDTIRALNEAHLHHYIGKPWTPEALHTVVRTQLTDYILHAQIDPLPYLSVLDGTRLLPALRGRTE